MMLKPNAGCKYVPGCLPLPGKFRHSGHDCKSMASGIKLKGFIDKQPAAEIINFNAGVSGAGIVKLQTAGMICRVGIDIHALVQ
jgi:hypothetical protein